MTLQNCPQLTIYEKLLAPGVSAVNSYKRFNYHTDMGRQGIFFLIFFILLTYSLRHSYMYSMCVNHIQLSRHNREFFVLELSNRGPPQGLKSFFLCSSVLTSSFSSQFRCTVFFCLQLPSRKMAPIWTCALQWFLESWKRSALFTS